MQLPTLSNGSQTRDITDTFLGYDHKNKISNGEWYWAKNLSTKDYPMVSTRHERSKVCDLVNPHGIIAKEKLAYVDNGILYYDGEATTLEGLSDSDKQMVSMGAYICIWPDKAYYNTADPTDYGYMEDTVTMSGTTTYVPCRLTGDPYEDYTISETAPEDPENGDIWYDTVNKSMKEWSSSHEEWVSIATVYTKITFSTGGVIGSHFKKDDGVTISGTAYPDVLDGSKVLLAVGGGDGLDDYIIINGLIESPNTSNNSVVISRTVPDLDYVCECSNRLWGCYYGTSDNGNINELYCCALGDFKNWNVFQGISTDSWVGSVGSDGPWTGAVNFLGYPTFFKDNRIHRITVSSSGAHSVTETVCRGVQAGSEKSLVVVNETLFYKSRTDICVYQGGFPEGISSALGDDKFYAAVAGAYGDRYYISMRDDSNQWHLFTFDSTNKLWMREDNLKVSSFASLNDSLYAVDQDHKTLLDLNGKTGDPEVQRYIEWEAISGIKYYEYPDKKYTSRYDIRLYAPVGTEVELYIQYDSDGIWRYCGKHFWRGTGSYAFPVRPRRCDHMQLKIKGTGEAKIYSIACILEQGSDM